MNFTQEARRESYKQESRSPQNFKRAGQALGFGEASFLRSKKPKRGKGNLTNRETHSHTHAEASERKALKSQD